MSCVYLIEILNACYIGNIVMCTVCRNVGVEWGDR